MLRITLQRLSNDRHCLTVQRDDGKCLEQELETRSALLHDLVHFAVESEAGIDDGFWGSLEAGLGFEDLRAEAPTTARPGLLRAESLVGPMQSVWNGRLDVERYLALVRGNVDRAFVDRVLERIRRLWGQWRGTEFHETMELTWPPACDEPLGSI